MPVSELCGATTIGFPPFVVRLAAGSRSGYYASFLRAACHEAADRAHPEIARLEVRYFEEVVKQRTLQSPIEGIVLERLLVPGEYVSEVARFRGDNWRFIHVYGPTMGDGRPRACPVSLQPSIWSKDRPSDLGRRKLKSLEGRHA
jgi:hypothetical protein